MTQHRAIPHLDLLGYALEGVRTRIGVGAGYIDDDYMEELEDDQDEIKRRIARAEASEAAKGRATP